MARYGMKNNKKFDNFIPQNLEIFLEKYINNM